MLVDDLSFLRARSDQIQRPTSRQPTKETGNCETLRLPDGRRFPLAPLSIDISIRDVARGLRRIAASVDGLVIPFTNSVSFDSVPRCSSGYGAMSEEIDSVPT